MARLIYRLLMLVHIEFIDANLVALGTVLPLTVPNVLRLLFTIMWVVSSVSKSHKIVKRTGEKLFLGENMYFITTAIILVYNAICTAYQHYIVVVYFENPSMYTTCM